MCKYRLVKIHKGESVLFWIQYPVKLFGIIIYWSKTSHNPYTDEKDAMADMNAMCSENYWRLLEIWKRENNFQ